MKSFITDKRVALPLALLGAVLAVGLTGCVPSGPAGPSVAKTTSQIPEGQIRPNTFTLANGQRVTMTATHTGNSLVGALTVLNANDPGPIQPTPTQQPTEEPDPDFPGPDFPGPDFPFPDPTPVPTAAFQRSQRGPKLGTQNQTFPFQIAAGTYPFTGTFTAPRGFNVTGTFGSQGAFTLTGEFATENAVGSYKLTVNGVTEQGILPRLSRAAKPPTANLDFTIINGANSYFASDEIKGTAIGREGIFGRPAGGQRFKTVGRDAFQLIADVNPDNKFVYLSFSKQGEIKVGDTFLIGPDNNNLVTIGYGLDGVNLPGVYFNSIPLPGDLAFRGEIVVAALSPTSVTVRVNGVTVRALYAGSMERPTGPKYTIIINGTMTINNYTTE